MVEGERIAPRLNIIHVLFPETTGTESALYRRQTERQKRVVTELPTQAMVERCSLMVFH